MADPIATRPGIGRSPGRVALKFVSRLIRPTIVTGMMAALIAPADTPTVLPLTCRITVTRVGGAWIYEPDCAHQSPPSPPSPERPAVWSRCTTRCALNSVVVAVDSFSLRGCQHGRGACSANTSRAAGHTCRGDDPVVARVSCWARPKMEWATARDAGADPQTAWSLLGSPTDSVTGSRIGWAAAE
jgi:hypothetical protein